MDQLAGAPKYKEFNVHSTSYKQVDSHPIAADVFVPKELASALKAGKMEKRPFIVRFHGGGLFSGMSLYAEWFPLYVLEYACKQLVPVISADYRLMPECKGVNILEDLGHFWDWLRRDNDGLQSFLHVHYPDLDIDKDRILAEGESAGGYLTAQAALSGFPGLKAAISAYPMLDLRDRYYQERFEKVMGGVQMLPESMITDHLAAMKPGEVVSCNQPGEELNKRLNLGTCIIQQGRFVEFHGPEDILYPVDRIKLGMYSEDAKDIRHWIYHGKQDTGIPAAGSIVFAEQAPKVWSPSEFRLTLEDGEHGFHKDKRPETTPWLKEGLEWVEDKWLRG